MTECSHINCSREQRVWLQKDSDLSKDFRKKSSTGLSDVALHHWCVLCGCVKNISDDRPKKMGYWVNIISKIERECFVAQSQKRLIIKELEKNELFEDMYGTTGSAQKELFVKTAKKYLKLREETIYSFIY